LEALFRQTSEGDANGVYGKRFDGHNLDANEILYLFK